MQGQCWERRCEAATLEWEWRKHLRVGWDLEDVRMPLAPADWAKARLCLACSETQSLYWPCDSKLFA